MKPGCESNHNPRPCQCQIVLFQVQLQIMHCAFPSAAADHAVPLTIVLLLPFTNMWYEIISEKATDCCLPVAGIVSQLQE